MKPPKRHRRGGQKGEGQAGRRTGPSRLRRNSGTAETDEEKRFTYEGTFILRDDDL